jgi:hypothetical protein
MTNAEIVAELGRRIWGDPWARPMSEFVGINPRTLRRIQAAAERGEDYPPARAVIGALGEALQALAADPKPRPMARFIARLERRGAGGAGGGGAGRNTRGR